MAWSSTRTGTRRSGRSARRPCWSARRTAVAARSASSSDACSRSAASRSSSRASAAPSAPAAGSIRSTSAPTAWRRCAGCGSAAGTPARSGRSARATWASCSGRSPTGRRAGAVRHGLAVPGNGVRQRQHLARHRAVVDAAAAGAGAAPGAAAARARAAAHAPASLRAPADRRARRARLRHAGPVLPRLDGEPLADSPYWATRDFSSSVGDVPPRYSSPAAGTTSSCPG